MLVKWLRLVVRRTGVPSTDAVDSPPSLSRLRAVAFVEGVGALVGIYGFLGSWIVSTDLNALLPVSIFASVLFQAFKTWRGDRRAAKRLSWFLAAQIPWLNLREINAHYDFHLSLACLIRLGNSAEPLEFGIGTRLNAYLGVEPDGAFVGINLVAVLLFVVTRVAYGSVSKPRGGYPN